jgi:hypothetical protein
VSLVLLGVICKAHYGGGQAALCPLIWFVIVHLSQWLRHQKPAFSSAARTEFCTSGLVPSRAPPPTQGYGIVLRMAWPFFWVLVCVLSILDKVIVSGFRSHSGPGQPHHL